MARHRHSRRTVLISALALSMTIAATASANEEEAEEQGVVVETKLVTEVETPRSDVREWFGPHFSIAKKHGFQYSRSFTVGKRERRFKFSIQGPILHKKTPGLAFEIKF